MPSMTSADNFRANTSTTDLVIAQPGDQGAVSIYNASGGAIKLIVDIQGWFSIDGNDDDGTLTTLPPVDPEETDLTDAPTDPAAVTNEPAAPTDTPGGNAPAGRFCDSGGVYRPTHLGGSYFGAPQSNYNGTSSKESSTFSAEASGTVGIILSGSLRVTLSELVSRQEFTFGVNLPASLTAKLGNSVSATIRRTRPSTPSTASGDDVSPAPATTCTATARAPSLRRSSRTRLTPPVGTHG